MHIYIYAYAHTIVLYYARVFAVRLRRSKHNNRDVNRMLI